MVKPAECDFVFLHLTFFLLVERLENITNMYTQELKTKHSLVSSTGLTSILTREEGVVLLSIWINQPSIVKSTLKDWDDICSTEMGL